MGFREGQDVGKGENDDVVGGLGATSPEILCPQTLLISGGGEGQFCFPGACYGFSAVGGRNSNEDGCFVDMGGKRFAIADGMGGFADGERMSALVLSVFSDGEDESWEECFLIRARAAMAAAIARGELSSQSGTTFAALREYPVEGSPEEVELDCFAIGDSSLIVLSPGGEEVLFESFPHSDIAECLEASNQELISSILTAMVHLRIISAEIFQFPSLWQEALLVATTSPIGSLRRERNPVPFQGRRSVRKGSIALLMSDGVRHLVTSYELLGCFKEKSFDDGALQLIRLINQRNCESLQQVDFRRVLQPENGPGTPEISLGPSLLNLRKDGSITHSRILDNLTAVIRQVGS